MNSAPTPESAPAYAHEDPRKGRFRPWIALDAIGKLIKDKEDTTQVFRILQSIRGNSFENMFARFVKSPVGSQVVARKRELFDVACDRDFLRGLPAGSFGRAYLAFMEGCGITPEGLQAARSNAGISDAIMPEDFRRFSDRIRVQHDMWHVVSGYGCEGLGEVCVVALSYPQTRNLGFAVIAVAGAFNYAKFFKDEPIWAATREAYRRGKRAKWLPEADWEAFMPQPLEAVRAQLGLADPPVQYLAATRCRADSFTQSPVAAAA